MLDRRDKSLRAVDGEWHAFRDRARKTAFSTGEFSDHERERYDLDPQIVEYGDSYGDAYGGGTVGGAGIDGRDNPDLFPDGDGDRSRDPSR